MSFVVWASTFLGSELGKLAIGAAAPVAAPLVTMAFEEWKRRASHRRMLKERDSFGILDDDAEKFVGGVRGSLEMLAYFDTVADAMRRKNAPKYSAVTAFLLASIVLAVAYFLGMLSANENWNAIGLILVAIITVSALFGRFLSGLIANADILDWAAQAIAQVDHDDRNGNSVKSALPDYVRKYDQARVVLQQRIIGTCIDVMQNRVAEHVLINGTDVPPFANGETEKEDRPKPLRLSPNMQVNGRHPGVWGRLGRLVGVLPFGSNSSPKQRPADRSETQDVRTQPIHATRGPWLDA